MKFKPGQLAVHWEQRAVFIRSYYENYWYDSRYPNIGAMLIHDDWVAEHCQVIRMPPSTARPVLD